MNLNEKLKNYLTHEENDFLKVENSYNKKLVTWLDLNLQVAQVYNFSSFILKFHFIAIINIFIIKKLNNYNFISS